MASYVMSDNDHDDLPGYETAFTTAYDQLAARGVTVAQVRGDLAEQVASTLCQLRHQHGMGYMLQIAQDRRGDLVNRAANLVDVPAAYTSISPSALAATIRATAQALA